LPARGSTGSELVLDQQQKALEQSALSPQDRASRVALQKQIHAAVVSGKGGRACRRTFAKRPTLRGCRAC
jgi:hypothetical protein